MRILKEESGQVLVVTALSMFVLLGFVGFATDVGNLLRVRRVGSRPPVVPPCPRSPKSPKPPPPLDNRIGEAP